MWYTEQEGTKHSNELCWTLIPAQLLAPAVPTKHGCGLSTDQLAAPLHVSWCFKGFWCRTIPPSAFPCVYKGGLFGAIGLQSHSEQFDLLD